MSVPKLAFTYWKGKNFSPLQILSVQTLSYYNPDLQIIIYYNVDGESNIIPWKTGEHTRELTSISDIFSLKELKNVTFKEVDFKNIFGVDVTNAVYLADIIRIYKLYEHGGIWFDLDIFFIKKIPDMFFTMKESLGLFKELTESNLFRCVPTGFIIAKPKNTFCSKLIACVSDILNDISNIKEYQKFGPHVWRQLYNEIHQDRNLKLPFINIKQSIDIRNYDSEYIYPYRPYELEKMYYSNTTNQLSPNLIGIHWFNGAAISTDFINTFFSPNNNIDPTYTMPSIIQNFKNISNIQAQYSIVSNIKQKNFIYNVKLLKHIVSTLDTKYLTHTKVYNKPIEDCKISIVMTANNRSKQTYFTLNTICRSKIKDIHVVIVDDSDTDKITIEGLRKFDLCIDFVEINKETKCWVNPCVNYNIGFQFVKCPLVIIQNAEVCHVGDVCENVVNSIKDDTTYLVYDLPKLESLEHNENVYKMDQSFETIYSYLKDCSWYSHHIKRPANFHFLTALSKKAFDRIGGFSYDYFSEGAYDDDDFVLKIKRYGFQIKPIPCEEANVMGIHQYHIPCYLAWSTSEDLNKKIFEIKSKQPIYFDITDRLNLLS